MSSSKPEWHVWGAGEAPHDRPILVHGKWKPFDIAKGGEDYWGIARWSTVQSNGTGYQWYLDFLSPLNSVNVQITNWRDLDKPLPPSPEPTP